jgi:hypothetical protein
MESRQAVTTRGVILMKQGFRAALRSAAVALLAAAGPSGAADEPAAPKLAEPRVPEALEMLWSIIVRGADMGVGKGWFHPSQTRYGWDWLASRFDKDQDGTIAPEELADHEPLFARLDRDRDGTITPADLDWSERSEYLRQRMPFRMKFSQADANSNGRVSREEFQALFEKAAGEKGYLTPDDLADLLGPPPRPKNAPSGPPPDMPSRWTLLKGLFSGEIGSMHEGPKIDEPGPNFSLKTHDGRFSVTLSDFRGHKPVVLIFGSFT